MKVHRKDHLVATTAFQWIVVLLSGAGSLLLAVPAQAIPAYARRYDTKCETCHYPLPPRLNNTGMLFRRWGFRLPDADENGKLTVKTVPAHGIGDAASIAASIGVADQQYPPPGENNTTLALGEVALIGGTAIGERLSSQAIFLLRNDEGEAELENVQLQYNRGTPNHQLNFRAGLVEPFQWMKGTHGTLTLSSTLPLSEEPLIPVGTFPGFALGLNQIEAEVGYTFSNLKNGKMMSTMLSASILNGVDETGGLATVNTTDGFDVLFQAIELIGASNTLGGFYYKGSTAIDPEGLLLPPGPFTDHFTRYGATGNYVLMDRVDLLGAYVGGEDESSQISGNVVSSGAYGQVDVTIRPRWIADFRYDYLDPDRNATGDLLHAETISTTYQAEDNLFLQAEYLQNDDNGAKSHGFAGVVRVVY